MIKWIKRLSFGLGALALTIGVSVQNAYAQISTTTIGDNVDALTDTGFTLFQDIILSKVFIFVVGIAILGYCMRLIIGWLKRGGR